MEFIIHNSLNPKVESAWKDLEENNNLITPFQKLQWIKDYIQFTDEYTSGKKKRIFLIVKKNTENILIFPLNIKLNFLKKLEYIGEPFNDINIPIINKNYIFEDDEISFIKKKLIKIFHNKIDCINFNNQPNYLPNNQINFFVFEKIYQKSFNYKINVNEQYLQNIKNHKFWKDVSRRNKKYLQQDNVTYKLLETMDEKEKAFKFFTKFKHDQMERTNKKNYLLSDCKKKFLKNFFFKNKIYALLSSENKIIACACCVLDNKILYYLFPAYDNLFNKCAPGQQLINYIISNNDIHFKIFDFTNGDEKYKKYWSNDRKIYSDTIISFNFKGLIFELLMRLKCMINKNFFYNNFLLKILKKFR